MQQDNNHMVLTVMAGFDGGLIIYDGSNGGSRLVFGGNIEEASRYITARMEKLVSEPPKEIEKVPAHLVQAYAVGSRDGSPLQQAMDAVERAIGDGE